MKQRNGLTSIFILIRSLGVGGAERQACVLAKALHDKGIIVTVGVFYSGGALEEELRKAGVSIYPLDKKGRWDLIGWFWRYIKAIRKRDPDVIYSFLPTSNIVALMGRLFINKPVVWGIRASYMNLEAYDWLAKLTAWVERKLSRFANIIIFNAQYSREYHETLGYRLQNAVVIPNGIDTDVFQPHEASVKAATRDQLGIPRDAVVVGMLARVDPMKDYETYLSAASALLSRHKKLYFIAAGAGTKEAPWTYPPRFIPLGIWENVTGLLNALDIMVLSSFGEGFPNVVGEAMACGIPTIVSDVGDAAYIVGDKGMTIPPKNPEALMQAVEALLKKSPSKESIRNRILEHFSVSQMVDLTLQTLTRAYHHP